MEIKALAERFFEYARYMRSYTPDTIRRYRSSLTSFLSSSGVRRIEDVSTPIVQSWFLRGRADKGWKIATFLTYHKTLVVFFRWCVKNGYLARSPMDEIEIPKLERRIPARLTKDEAMRLLTLRGIILTRVRSCASGTTRSLQHSSLRACASRRR